jgi:hypothetical protein
VAGTSKDICAMVSLKETVLATLAHAGVEECVEAGGGQAMCVGRCGNYLVFGNSENTGGNKVYINNASVPAASNSLGSLKAMFR